MIRNWYGRICAEFGHLTNVLHLFIFWQVIELQAPLVRTFNISFNDLICILGKLKTIEKYDSCCSVKFFFIWRHGGHIFVFGCFFLSFGKWVLFRCNNLLLLMKTNMAAMKSLYYVVWDVLWFMKGRGVWCQLNNLINNLVPMAFSLFFKMSDAILKKREKALGTRLFN